jgi:hypothetical protein
MAEQPIKKSEIIEDNIFSSLIKEADVVIQKEKELIETNKKLLSSYKDIANVQLGNDSKALIDHANNVKKVNTSIKNLTDSELYLIEVEKAKKQLQQEELKLSNAIERQNKAQERALNQLNGEYKKGTKDLANLKQQLKELEFTGRTNGKLYKSLTKEFNDLDAKVRKAEKSVGEFHRNVGNYPKVLDSITGKLAAAFSVGAVVNFGQKILETRAEFQKYEAVLTNTLGSNAAATKSMEMIQAIAAKTPFSVNELTESYVKLVNRGFKPTNKEIIKLGDLAASQGKQFDQLTEALLDAQSGEFERLKEFGVKAKVAGDQVTLSFKDQQVTVDKFNETALRNAIIGFGELEGVAGGMAAISETLGGKVSNLGDNFDAFFNNLGKNSEGIFAFFLDQFNDFLGLVNESQTSIIKINDILKKGGSKQSFTESFFGGNTQLVSLQQNLTAIANSGKSYLEIQRNYGKALEIVKKQYEAGTITAKEYNDSLLLIGAAIKGEKEATESDNKAKEKNIKLTKQQTKANVANNEVTNIKATQVQEEKKFDDKAFEDKIEKERRDRESIEAEKMAAFNESQRKKKERQEKERQEFLEFEQQILDAVAQAEAAKSQERQDAFDKQISDTEQNIETQRRLAEKGQKNTLAEEEARKIQIERKKQQEKEEEIKRQKVLAFFKLYSAYAEKDPDNALQKALKDTILAEAVAAAFIEGTENVANDPQFNKNKYKNGEDGYIARFDGRERILNPEQNAKIGGLSNDELADLAHKANNGLLDTVRYAAIPTDNFATNIANSALLMETVALKKEMQEVKQAIKDIPVPSFRFDNHGNFIAEEIQNGFTKATLHKFKRPKLG